MLKDVEKVHALINKLLGTYIFDDFDSVNIYINETIIYFFFYVFLFFFHVVIAMVDTLALKFLSWENEK